MDHRTVSSDGFMTNLQIILLKLFEPVMDTSFSKVSFSRDFAYVRLIKSTPDTSKILIESTLKTRPRSGRRKRKPTLTLEATKWMVSYFRGLG